MFANESFGAHHSLEVLLMSFLSGSMRPFVAAVEERAANDHTTTSDVIREALRRYLDGRLTNPTPHSARQLRGWNASMTWFPARKGSGHQGGHPH